MNNVLAALGVVIVDESYAEINALLYRQPNVKCLGSFSDGAEAIEFIHELKPDVVICGIETAVFDGLEPIATFVPQPIFIVLVDEVQYASIKQLGPSTIFYPILKRPVNKARLLALLNKFSHERSRRPKHLAQEKRNASNTEQWFLKYSSGYLRIDSGNVNYFKSENGQVFAHVEGYEKDCVELMLSMKELEKQLPAQIFLRIHKSYMVNLKKVTHLDNHEMYIGDKPLPIGRAYKSKVKQLILS